MGTFSLDKLAVSLRRSGAAKAIPLLLNVSSITDILTYIERKDLAHGSGREVLVKKGDDPRSIWINREGLNNIDFVTSFQIHPPSWEYMPWVDPTAPMEFGNVSMIDMKNPSRSSEARVAKSPRTEDNQFYETTIDRIGNFAIIFNYQQLQYWYGTKYP